MARHGAKNPVCGGVGWFGLGGGSNRGMGGAKIRRVVDTEGSAAGRVGPAYGGMIRHAGTARACQNRHHHTRSHDMRTAPVGRPSAARRRMAVCRRQEAMRQRAAARAADGPTMRAHQAPGFLHRGQAIQRPNPEFGQTFGDRPRVHQSAGQGIAARSAASSREP